jgi:hypothetical protein
MGRETSAVLVVDDSDGGIYFRYFPTTVPRVGETISVIDQQERTDALLIVNRIQNDVRFNEDGDVSADGVMVYVNLVRGILRKEPIQ